MKNIYSEDMPPWEIINTKNLALEILQETEEIKKLGSISSEYKIDLARKGNSKAVKFGF